MLGGGDGFIRPRTIAEADEVDDDAVTDDIQVQARPAPVRVAQRRLTGRVHYRLGLLVKLCSGT